MSSARFPPKSLSLIYVFLLTTSLQRASQRFVPTTVPFLPVGKFFKDSSYSSACTGLDHRSVQRVYEFRLLASLLSSESARFAFSLIIPSKV